VAPKVAEVGITADLGKYHVLGVITARHILVGTCQCRDR
jgi:hypothetical protein